jgi:hypothetical protein
MALLGSSTSYPSGQNILQVRAPFKNGLHVDSPEHARTEYGRFLKDFRGPAWQGRTRVNT